MIILWIYQVVKLKNPKNSGNCELHFFNNRFDLFVQHKRRICGTCWYHELLLNKTNTRFISGVLELNEKNIVSNIGHHDEFSWDSLTKFAYGGQISRIWLNCIITAIFWTAAELDVKHNQNPPIISFLPALKTSINQYVLK